MRITKIEIKNFKAFYGHYEINLYKSGHNLLVYGENGSGKTSLALALNLFLEASVKRLEFNKHKNIFVKDKDGFVKIYLGNSTYEWSTTNICNEPLIIEASKTKGFIDYKSLLETHFLHWNNKEINIFHLLVENILANTINDVTKKRFIEDWESIKRKIPIRNYERYVKLLEKSIEPFNDGLASKLGELKTKASEILKRFEYDIEIDFVFEGVKYNKPQKSLDGTEIILKTKYFNRPISAHHHFLNEAKLSAIALSIYFASLLLIPDSDLKILVLDDVLIGLDISNRLPVLDILKEYFSDYQIFFMTYDKAWYEIVKQRFQKSKWKYVELYYSKSDEYEIPVCFESQEYLEKSKEFFESHDYKASVIYLRAAFEKIIKNFCQKMQLSVRYHENLKKLNSDDFWKPIKTGKKDATPFISKELIENIELYRSIILNPFSHSRVVVEIKDEIKKAIDTVERLKKELNDIEITEQINEHEKKIEKLKKKRKFQI